MKTLTILAVFVAGLLAGCQGIPAPAPGMASVRIHVMAEPKVGVRPPADQPALYDAPGGRNLGSGAFELVDYAELDQIVIWLEPLAPAADAAIAPVTIDVDPGKSAASLAKAVSVKQPVTLRNIGPKAGNFYSASEGNEFDLRSLAPGATASFTLHAPGLVEILSDHAKDPVAEIYAAPSRWVALSRSGGTVDFSNVPPGRYKLVSWHPRLPGYETIITLPPDQIATATIKVGVNALPKVGPR